MDSFTSPNWVVGILMSMREFFGDDQDFRNSKWVFPKIGVTPKSSILIGFSTINHPFSGTPIFGNTQIGLSSWGEPFPQNFTESNPPNLHVLSKSDPTGRTVPFHGPL